MSDKARNAILSRLSKQRSDRADPPATSSNKCPDHGDASNKGVPDLATFKALLSANHAEVIECTQRNFEAELTDWFNRNANLNGRRLISRHPKLLALFEQAGKNLNLSQYHDEEMDALFDSIETSICYAEGAVADKGALLVIANPEQPRTLSLIPPVNILVLKERNVFQDLQTCFNSSHFDKTALSSNAVLISGPSKTADIQQTLAYGAHGPKRLIVFLLA